MNNIQEQKCPNCTGPLRFDPILGKLVCDYCDGVFDIEQEEEQPLEDHVEGFDFHALLRQKEIHEDKNFPVYMCKSCGAEILAAEEEISLTCPFCQSNVVLTDKISGNIRPDGIIPFKIKPDKLPKAVRNYYKGQKFIHKKFFTENKMGKVTGMYVPFWVFSGKASGRICYEGEQYSNRRRKGDYVISTYNVYELDNEVSLSFKDLLLDASEKMEDAMMDSIAPFDLSEIKPFDVRYLAGYSADRFDVAPASTAKRAEKQMCKAVGALAKEKVAKSYRNVCYLRGKLQANMDAKYILMPIYQFELNFGMHSSKFVVNGQTGKVVGKLPYDENMMGSYYMKKFAIITAAVFAIPLIRYFLGG